MNELDAEVVKVGDYVVVQRQNYYKLHKVTANGNLLLGKDQLEMSSIIGRPMWTTYKMEAKVTGKRLYTLLETKEVESLSKDLKSVLPSGLDNRSIIDDGTSQQLSTEDIVGLREAGKSSKEIVGKLIENSKTFQNKTEYSQAKYLKKKEKKYFEYITIRKPTIRLIQDIYFRMDHQKISSLRMDTLAQLLSYSGVNADGLYMVYDSGSQGLPASAMLHRIGAGTNGKLIHMHPGNIPQRTLIQAMNFPEEQLRRMLTVNIYSLIRMYYQGTEQFLEVSKYKAKSDTLNVECIVLESNDTDFTEDVANPKVPKAEAEVKAEGITEDNSSNRAVNSFESKGLKRKLKDAPSHEPPKKPKWLIETQEAVEIMKVTKADGLAIIAKEHPLNIIKGLLPFLGISRPFVIYHSSREPLQETYVALKQRSDVINLRLFANFLRSHQVLPDRTHPDILMSDTGGYLLYGYLVD
ncbi:tRNA (adenine(58)-N(1))-methyltransferase non-catalytic subunit TRM6 [Neodiprion lecontei]|uniref:tRNA (adenine(58)-N(1))-methyltransferase non-catalytic subunit TRM6 n=1 Tax=Neodiprion lecontei TaxID=441921 RepID=A0A6J0C679_NEOLC|nr:tRNA (adenine(58)-N(1))-methyltransferase non-catalytic subunit TRM6 [Neodiprion lecontei]